jgi:hypothetical protein
MKGFLCGCGRFAEENVPNMKYVFHSPVTSETHLRSCQIMLYDIITKLLQLNFV